MFKGKATVLYRMRLSCKFYDREGKEIGKPGEGESLITIYIRFIETSNGGVMTNILTHTSVASNE